ncbi:TPA: restriction endonuclease subunit S, partial [Stenotrophomonas maltophilia]|nr:restriction endonuclease subunit S [Stenotrophomonas maltophilia]
VGCVVLFKHEFDAITSNFVARMRPLAEFDSQFLCYAFGNLYRGRVNYPSVKQVTGIQNLDAESYLQERFCFPARVEQAQIARFLDHETASIDALIEEQQRLIELLKEKRQAVISHAVTKGLDPRVPMKDSGVEWLGEVPAHWKQIRIKHILNAMIDAEHKTAEYSDDGEYLVCRTTNVRNGLLSLDGAKYADRNTYIDWTRRGVPEPLDILFTREAPAGEACLVPENLEVCLGQRMVLFKLDKTRIDPAFTVHSIYAGLASDFVKKLSQGSTVSHFNMADIGNIPLFEPPLSEQKGISDFLAKRCDSYDLLINEAQSSVKLISERRSALISAAVTGKIDVRGWQPPTRASFPELEEEAV